jgi:predicted N-formylglutamate amidohydrolase
MTRGASRSRGASLVLTCEHGGNRVPRAYAPLFRGHRALLQSHRGLDAGALPLARFLGRELSAPLVAGTTTRLLADLNRPPGDRALFSEITRGLEPGRREEILRRHHRPHWERVRAVLREAARVNDPVLHLGVHSFTPRWRGEARRCDVGLLYDPARSLERGFASSLREAILRRDPSLVVRRNYPYRGNAAGLTTTLRGELPASHYLGIELEVNQKHPLGSPRSWKRLQQALGDSLREALETWRASPPR